jgi:hypothetical protein
VNTSTEFSLQKAQNMLNKYSEKGKTSAIGGNNDKKPNKFSLIKPNDSFNEDDISIDSSKSQDDPQNVGLTPSASNDATRLGFGLGFSNRLGLVDMLRFDVVIKSLVWLVCIPYPNPKHKPDSNLTRKGSFQGKEEREPGTLYDSPRLGSFNRDDDGNLSLGLWLFDDEYDHSCCVNDHYLSFYIGHLRFNLLTKMKMLSNYC